MQIEKARALTIAYPDDLLLSLKETPEEFERQARLLLAVKFYEMGKISSGMAARLAGMKRVEFLLELNRFGMAVINTPPDELAQDVANA